MVQRSVLTGVGVAVASVLVFLGVTALTLQIPRERILHEIRAGFDEGSILPQNYPQPKDYWRLGRDQWTDCATFQMALRGDAPFYQELITPRRYSIASADPKRGPCQLLREATDPAGSPGDLQTWRYHRYLHGSTVLTRIALSTTSVNGLRNAIKVSILCFGGLALALMLWSFISSRRSPARALASVSLVTVFLACFGISQHAASISHGPSAALVILSLSLIPFWDGAKLNRLLVIAALFGSATAILEFLDGGSPLGLALILGMSVLDALDPVETRAPPRGSVQIIQGGVSTALAFATSVVTALALKVVLSRWAYGSEGSSSFFDQLAMWVGGSPLLAVDALRALDKQIGVIVPLNDTAFRVLVVALAAACTFILLKMKNLRGGGGIVLLSIGSLAIVPLWYLIFRIHTTVHAWFMVRMLAWPIAFSVSLVVWWIVFRSTSSSTARR